MLKHFMFVKNYFFNVRAPEILVWAAPTLPIARTITEYY